MRKSCDRCRSLLRRSVSFFAKSSLQTPGRSFQVLDAWPRNHALTCESLAFITSQPSSIFSRSLIEEMLVVIAGVIPVASGNVETRWRVPAARSRSTVGSMHATFYGRFAVCFGAPKEGMESDEKAE